MPDSLGEVATGTSPPLRASPKLLGPLYVWSVALEPLLFFIVADRAFTGVMFSLSRLLQAFVICGLCCRIAARLFTQGTIRRPWARGDGWLLYSPFWLYFGLAIVAGAIGVVSGAYGVSDDYGLNSPESGFARTLNSNLARPAFEYVIALYYFLYFVVLAPVFLRTRTELRYMFDVFSALFLISFVAGIADLATGWLFNIEWLPRTLADGRIIGARFHGLAGEPRTAFVYLFLGWAIFHLRATFLGRRLHRWAAPIIIVAAILTESTSGLIGLACFVLLFAAYSLSRLSPRRAAELAVVVTVIAVTLALVVATSRRTRAYVEASSSAWAALEAGQPLPSPLNLQQDNIYPLYDFVNKVRQFELLPVLIGSGLGSASAATNRISAAAENEMINPNAQIVRTLYENGLLGTFLFVMLFALPIQQVTGHLTTPERNRFMIMLLLMVGCAFGTRSSAPFIYVGLTVAAFRVMKPAAGITPLRSDRPE